MKKLALVSMILIVAFVVGIYVYVELKVPEIVFVTDRSTVLNANETSFVTRRLYSSGVDSEKFSQWIQEKLTTTQFSEEEIMQAALSAGTPEFYPAFYVSVFSSEYRNADFLVSAKILNEAAPGQNNSYFDVDNVRLEVVSNGFAIENTDIVFQPSLKTELKQAPVISNDKSTMAVILGNIKTYCLDFSGTQGTIVFRYTYDVVAHGLYTRTVIKDCVYEFQLGITSENGEYFITFSPSSYSSLAQLQSDLEDNV